MLSRKLKNNIPNILTLSRLVAIPLFVASFYISVWLAVFVFAFASITDFFDGYLARYWSVQSKLGKFLDPMADKLIIIISIIMLIHLRQIDGVQIIPALVIIAREIVVNGIRNNVMFDNKHTSVLKIAKIKTFFQMIALLLLLLCRSNNFIKDNLHTFSIALLWFAAILTLHSGIIYLFSSIKSFASEEK